MDSEQVALALRSLKERLDALAARLDLIDGWITKHGETHGWASARRECEDRYADEYAARLRSEVDQLRAEVDRATFAARQR